MRVTTDSALATFPDSSISDVKPFMIHAMSRTRCCQRVLLPTSSNSATRQAVRFKKTHERQVFWIFRNHFSVNSATAELPWRCPTAVSRGHPLSLRPQMSASQMPGWRLHRHSQEAQRRCRPKWHRWGRDNLRGRTPFRHQHPSLDQNSAP